MRTFSKILIVVSLNLFAVIPAFASQNHDRAKHHDGLFVRLEHQDHRIDQGVRKHRLTRKEAKRLRAQQREIRYLVRKFYRDGHLSKRERRLLDRELNKSSRQIERSQRHNHRERYAYREHAHRR